MFIGPPCQDVDDVEVASVKIVENRITTARNGLEERDRDVTRSDQPGRRRPTRRPRTAPWDGDQAGQKRIAKNGSPPGVTKIREHREIDRGQECRGSPRASS